MARTTITLTETFREFDGAFRPIDQTFETVERTKRDGTLMIVVIGALAAIIIVFVVMAFIAAIVLKSPKNTSMAPPCTKSVSPALASLLPEEAGTYRTLNVTISDGVTTETLAPCSAKTGSWLSTSTEGRMLRVSIGAPTEESAKQLWRLVAASTSTWPARRAPENGGSATSKGPVTLCRLQVE